MDIHGDQEKEHPLQIVERKSKQSSAGFALVASVINECAIIMSEYSNTEYADMHLMYGQEHGNTCLAQQMYRSNFRGDVAQVSPSLQESIDDYERRDPLNKHDLM